MSTETSTDSTAKLSEAEFLKQEADRARKAISKTLADFTASLGRAADPHRLTQDHPYLAVGAAAVAGFAAAAALVPSRHQQAVQTLASIERALRQPTNEPAKGEVKKEAAAGGWAGMVIAEVLKLARPLLTTLITSSLSGAGSAPGDPSDGNGAPDANEHPAVSSPS